MLFRIHLPGLVRQGRAGHVDDGTATGGGGGQVMLHEPPLQRACGRDDLRGHPLEQVHPDQAGAPGRVLAAQPQRGLDRDGGLDRGVGGAMVGRLKALVAAMAEPRQESTDGRARQSERRGDLMGLTTLLPEAERGQTDRDGDRAWHGYGSRRLHHVREHPLVYPCPGAIKPGVAIKRSNLTSRDIFDAPAPRTSPAPGHRRASAPATPGHSPCSRG
jgi:hypothetical protein